MDIFWTMMGVAAILFAVMSPIWWLNIIMLFVALEYFKMASEI